MTDGKRASSIRVRVRSAVVFLLAALFAYRAERDCDLIKVKPYNFAAEQAALNSLAVREVDAVRRLAERMGNTFDEAAALYLAELRTPEQRRRGALPLAAYLSLTCAWVGGPFHSWTSMGARLEDARMAESDPMEIEIEYSVPGRYNRSSWTFRLPVPGGQENEAGRIAGELRRTAAGG